MGTDAHAFIEIDRSSRSPFFCDKSDIVAFNSGELWIERNYDLFDALADARSSRTSASSVRRALFPPRGLPSVVSDAVEARYYLRVVQRPEQVLQLCQFQPIGGGIPNFIEESLVRRLALQTFEREGLQLTDGKLTMETWVANPDWHSATWLFADEVGHALSHFELALDDLGPSTRAALAVLHLLESDLGPRRARFVVWFDN